MADEVTTTASEPAAPIESTTNDSNQVAKPFVTAKPYDDDMLEAYEAETAEAETPAESSPEGAKEEAPKEEAKPDEPAKEPEAKSKEGDKEIDGIENLPIKQIINGKEVNFKVKDAIQAYVKQEEFNRNMDRRITSVSKREQAWANDQTNFKSKLGKLMEVAQGGDFVTAVRGLAKIALAGAPSSDVTEFEKKYFDQLDKVREVYTKLTPEQREAYFAKRALAEAQAKAKELEDEKVFNTEKTQLQSKVETLQKGHGVSEQEFWTNYKAMEENLVGEGKDFKDSSDITPEDVVKFSLQVRHEEKILEAAEKVGIEDETILEEISKVTASEPNLTVEQIVKVIEDAGLGKKASPQAVENLNRKAGKSNTRFSQASSTKKENGKIEGIDPEDLDFLYRNQPKVYSRPAR